MIEVLREFVENGMRIIEYTRDGVNVSHRVEIPVQNETAGEQLPPLPSNPLLQLQQENAELKERIETIQQALDDLLLGGV